MTVARVLLISCICGTGVAFGAPGTQRPPRAEQIAPNDNAHRAGHLRNGVLTVALEARNGEWHPESGTGPTYAVAAFAEGKGALQTPGPLLRAPVGTEIRVTMHNALAKAMWVYGLEQGRGYGDSVQIAAGETRDALSRDHARNVVLRRAHVDESRGRAPHRRFPAQRRDRDRPAGRDTERPDFRD